MKEQQKNQKTAYLELLRIIACFFVIVNHTNSGVFLSQTPDHKVWWISLTYFFMCKTAVPVFLMITGCLMLGKIDNYRKYITRIIRMALVIVLFSFIYYVKSMQDAGRPIEIIEYFKLIYQRHVTNAYWYLYLYLGILLMMPFFQILSTNMKRREYQILMLISVVAMGGLPVLIHYRPGFSLSYMFTEPFPSVYVGMLFVGYYLTHYVEVKKKYAIISAVLFIGLVAAEVVLTFHEYNVRPESLLFLEERTNLNITLSAVALFYLARYFGSVFRKELFWKVIVFVGSCSFGIYLFSDLFVNLYEQFYNNISVTMNSMIAVLIYECMVFFSGLVLTVILKKIPYLKKLV